jgi:hypothetical protein
LLENCLWIVAALGAAVACAWVVASAQDSSRPQQLTDEQQAYVRAVATQQAESFIEVVAAQASQASTAVAQTVVSPPTTAPRPTSVRAEPSVAAPTPRRVAEPTTLPAAEAHPGANALPADGSSAISTAHPTITPTPFDARYLDHIQCSPNVYQCSGNSRGVDVSFGCDERANGDLDCAGVTAHGEDVDFYCIPDPNWQGREYEHWYCS